MTPDQEIFQDHILENDFRNGVVLSQWDVHPLEGVTWPNLIMWVSAAPRPNSPNKYHFRFTLDEYPKNPPTSHVCLENGTKAPDAKWPSGVHDVAMVFCVNNWEFRNALYAPWDRAGLLVHGEWKDLHKGVAWEKTFTITHYLNRVYNLLNHDDYKGTVEAGNS